MCQLANNSAVEQLKHSFSLMPKLHLSQTMSRLVEPYDNRAVTKTKFTALDTRLR